MVFNPPTVINFTNADLYAYERFKIQQYNFNLRFRPEIMSHTYIEISYNTQLNDNIEIPWYRKIRFNVRSRKRFCSQSTCQSHYPRGKTCTVDDEPRIFKTGDHDVEACEFGCYNLYEKAHIPVDLESETGSNKDENEDKVQDDKNNTSDKVETNEDRHARAPFLIYSYRQCACTMHNNGLFALGTDDYARTDYHPMPRIDTIGTGFHYIDSGNFFEREDFSTKDNQPFLDNAGNESFRFNVNRYYCDDFRLKFDGRKCYESVGEKIFGFLVSSTLYKACQYGVRFAATGVTNTDVQKLNLPPIKYEVHHKTLNSWKNDINIDAFFIDPNVSLTDLGFTSDMKHCIFTTQYSYPGELVEPLESGKNLTGHLIDYGELNKDRLHQFKYDVKTGQRIIDEYEIYGIYQYIRTNPTGIEFGDGSQFDNPHNQLVDLFKSLFENLGEISVLITLNIMIAKGVTFSKRLMLTAEQFLEGTITPTLLYIIERELLTQALHPVIRIFSKAIASAARATASLIKMADVFTTIAGVLDLIDIGVDFFNMNRVMDTGTIQQYSQLDIDTMRRAYGYGTVEYSPVSFMLMCEYLKIHEKWRVPPATIQKLRCSQDYVKYKYMLSPNAVTRHDIDNGNTYEWISEYIFSLRVNSNGLTINWDDEKKLSSDVIEQYLNINENVYLKGMDEYSKYTETFRKRVTLSRYALISVILLFVLILFVYIRVAAPFIFLAAITACYIVFSYFQR